MVCSFWFVKTPQRKQESKKACIAMDYFGNCRHPGQVNYGGGGPCCRQASPLLRARKRSTICLSGLPLERNSEAFTKRPVVVLLDLAPSQSFGPIVQQHHVDAARPRPYLSDYERAFVFTRLLGTKPPPAMLILGPVVAFVATS